MGRVRHLGLWVVACVFFCAQTHADVVRGKKHATQNRMELGAFVFNTSLRNVFVEHPYAAQLAVGYHVFDWLQLQLVGGYVFSRRETSALRQIRGDLPSDFDRGLNLRDLWQTVWNVGVDAQWAPFYGKVSLFAEGELRLQLYALVGLALEGTQRVTNAVEPAESATRFALSPGLGLRLFVTERIAIRSEIRQTFGFNPDLLGQADVSSTTWLQLGIGIFI